MHNTTSIHTKNATKTRLYAFSLTFTLLLTLLSSLPAAAMEFMDGKDTEISALTGQGRWTVFKIWASNCHVCHKTMHYMEDLTLIAPEVDVYGVSIDLNKKDAERFIKNHQLSFPNLLAHKDEVNGILATQAGETLFGTPTVMLYNPKGRLIAVQPGAVTAEDLVAFIEKQGVKTGSS